MSASHPAPPFRPHLPHRTRRECSAPPLMTTGGPISRARGRPTRPPDRPQDETTDRSRGRAPEGQNCGTLGVEAAIARPRTRTQAAAPTSRATSTARVWESSVAWARGAGCQRIARRQSRAMPRCAAAVGKRSACLRGLQQELPVPRELPRIKEATMAVSPRLALLCTVESCATRLGDLDTQPGSKQARTRRQRFELVNPSTCTKRDPA